MKLAIIDFNRTIYDPETNGLVPGAFSMLQALSAVMPLVLVSKLEQGREEILNALGVDHFFKETVFTPAKSSALFMDIIGRHGGQPHTTYIIGDYFLEEITHGNNIGAKTIWLRRGKFAKHVPKRPGEQAWRIIEDLSEIEELVK